MTAKQITAQLQEAVNTIASRGWCPATGGNFSARIDRNSCAITASGVDKTALKEEDLLIVDFTGKPLSTAKKPSAETILHTTLYSLSENIGAVLHTHTVAATVLSNYFTDRSSMVFSGYEMQKALNGITSHEEIITIPILNNNQNIPALAAKLTQRWEKETFNYAFLVRGHGLYAWGKNIQAAKRHLEGIEFLLSCELNKMLLGARQL